MEPLCSAKLRLKFATPEDMQQDTGFWASFRLWASRAKLSNMHVERLLAQVRKSVPTDVKRPLMERVVANSFLGQFCSRYVAAGGRDVRVETADDLISVGVQLERSFRRFRSKRGGARGWMLFAHDRLRDLKKSAGKGKKRMPRPEYRDLLKRLRLEFHQAAPAVQEEYGEQARARNIARRKKMKTLEAEAPVQSMIQGLHSFGTHSATLPLDEDLFVNTILGGQTLTELSSFAS